MTKIASILSFPNPSPAPRRRRLPFRSVLATATVLALLAAASSRASAVSCGDTIAAGAKITLTDADPITSTTCTTNPALTITGPASVDLAGFQIRCSSTGRDGIVLVGEKAKLENGSVHGCNSAVYLQGTGSHTVKNIVALASQGGFVIEELSDKNSLGRCAASYNVDDGFAVYSHRNKFQECASTNNGEFGFNVDGDGNVLLKVVSSNNGGSGLLFEPFDPSYGIKCSKSTFAANAGPGMSTDGGTGVFLKDNQAIGNSEIGFLLQDSDDSKLSGNVAAGNQGGFTLEGDRIKASRNTATGNTGDGFYLSEGDAIVISGNRVTANQGGIGVANATRVTNAVVTNNVALGSDGDDIYDTSACASTTFSRNLFGTKGQDCIE